MMRSLFSGVAGLRNHQTGMDVIGANISNVNTIGYKGSRTNFSDVISQTMQGASAATGTRGGTNPIQIGLGMGLAAVDSIMTSGSYQPTGKQTDLAIQNEGFFIVSDGLNQYYTRAGAFDFDGAGNYSIPGTGLKVMGWLGADGVVDTSGQIANIVIPSGITLPAVATTSMTFINNLSGTDTPGASAQTSLEVYDSLGKVYTLQDKFVKIDDINNVWLSKAGLTDKSIAVANALTEITFDKLGAISTVKQVSPGYAPDPLAVPPYYPTLKLKDGLQLNGTAADTNTISGVTLIDATGVAKQYDIVFTNSTTYNIYAASDTLHATSLQTGTATWDGVNGKYTFSAPAATDLVTLVNDAGVASAAGSFSATVNVGTVELSIPMMQLDNTSGSVHAANYTVFDNDLTPHVVKMEFTQTSANNWSYTLTEAGVTGATALLSGTVTWDAGTSTYLYNPAFDASSFDVGTGSALTSITLGAPAAFLAPSGASFNAACASAYVTSTTVNPVEFTPAGANKVAVTLDVGALTQYGGTTTVQASKQNGNAAGALDTVSIDTSGMIVGKFSNGKTMNLARVALATFTNASGLSRAGDTLFAMTNNSGNPAIGTSGTGGRGSITPGTLEMSNIDLADQFSKMIITQRGFQANSKIITTTDTMLEELVNLKR
jgi:flagellar hook protein FlgE